MPVQASIVASRPHAFVLQEHSLRHGSQRALWLGRAVPLLRTRLAVIVGVVMAGRRGSRGRREEGEDEDDTSSAAIRRRLARAAEEGRRLGSSGR